MDCRLSQELQEQRNVRAVILTGEGTSFSAGIDLGDLQSPRNIVTAMWELSRPGPNLFQRLLFWRFRLRKSRLSFYFLHLVFETLLVLAPCDALYNLLALF